MSSASSEAVVRRHPKRCRYKVNFELFEEHCWPLGRKYARREVSRVINPVDHVLRSDARSPESNDAHRSEPLCSNRVMTSSTLICITITNPP